MGKKIYVGNLSYNVGDQELGEVFAQFGNVESARIVIDRDSGRSKGFAFVEMATDDEAKVAIEKLNGTDLAGRNMNVSEAKPMAPREGGGRGGFGGGGNRGGGFGGGNRGGGSGGGRPRY
ncbi:RNA recognition motif domain-containing protein [Bdellovibrio svalbardensis]|uniref:RNA-binding protein n=1 Tax=Bdellovibrio svalbardensis TaxID=2972972 RepID=A0ABT6DIM8_9BACT|nr:RNA-binding protein [Bdellovibrio svalbardensis]MDG0816687.1 RNA-binding protein [Bdellovibrio svalbardensis]